VANVFLIHKISTPVFSNIRSGKAGSRSKSLPFYACHALLFVAQGLDVYELFGEFPPDFHGIAGDISGDFPAGCPLKFLLKPGRKYEEAVKKFQSYDRIQEKNNEACAAGAKLIAGGTRMSRNLVSGQPYRGINV